MSADPVAFPVPTDDDIKRVGEVLRTVGGRNLHISTNDVLDVLKLEHQMRAEKMATDRVVLVSWVLVFVTVASVIASVATLASG